MLHISDSIQGLHPWHWHQRCHSTDKALILDNNISVLVGAAYLFDQGVVCLHRVAVGPRTQFSAQTHFGLRPATWLFPFCPNHSIAKKSGTEHRTQLAI